LVKVLIIQTKIPKSRAISVISMIKYNSD